jgi:co-chaperonin GroES (HSP10)
MNGLRMKKNLTQTFYLTLPGYHILVRPVSVKSKTKGGLLLPDSVKDDVAYLTTVGKVLSIGDLAYKDEDKFSNGKWCDVGDYVCYARHAGQKLYYKGVRLLLLFDDQVMMKVDEPTNLDMTYNLSN